MRFVDSAEKFGSFVTLAGALVDASKNIPNNVFTEKLNLFLFITFDEVRMRVFFSHLKKFLERIGETEFIYLVVDPMPDDYLCEDIKKYKAIEFSTSDNDNQFISALNEYSGGSVPDSIMDNSDQILIMSKSQEWCVFADRDSDIAVCAFSTQRFYENFKSEYGEDLLPSTEAAAEYAYGERNDTEKIRLLIKNYSS